LHKDEEISTIITANSANKYQDDDKITSRLAEAQNLIEHY
jgi:hypothetical protein